MSSAPLFDAEAKEAFLELIRQGFFRYEAARRLGFRVATVKKHVAADPEFAEALEDAYHEMTEPVERGLYEAALAREPWAVTKWLGKRDKDRWAEEDIKVKHEIEIGPGLQGVAALISELQKRHALRSAEAETLHTLSHAPIIDVESEEIIPEKALTRPNPQRKAPNVG